MDNYTIAEYSIQKPIAPDIDAYLEYLTISMTFLIFVLGALGLATRVVFQHIQKLQLLFNEPTIQDSLLMVDSNSNAHTKKAGSETIYLSLEEIPQTSLNAKTSFTDLLKSRELC